ncbi:MAG: PepSY domain-containing protein, partial [Burkholderiaceae bacterium]
RARAALRAGEVLPLQVLLQRVQAEYPGRVLGIELEREDGRWIYEVKLLDPSGQLNKLELNAATGAVLRLRRR